LEFGKIFQSFGPQPSISRSISGTGRSKSYRYSPIPEVDLELEWNQRHHTCNYFKSFKISLVSQSATSLANSKLMKDKIQRRLAHARRHHSHEGNAHVVAVAALSFVVVTSVSVARPLKKPAEFRAS